MFKDVIVNVSVAPSRDVATEVAVSLAATFNSHLTGIAFQYEPLIPSALMEGVPSYVIESQRRESEQAARSALTRFDEAATRASLSSESRLVGASVGGAADHFGRIARRFDLAIIGQAEPDKAAPEELIIESALFESGRPILVVPYIQKGGLALRRILLCWDGSRNAARAIADAMPFLELSDQVYIVMVERGGLKSDEIPGADIAQHLRRHGVHCKVERIVDLEVDAADVILSRASDVGANLLIMGGYGHSRLREFILGGVTRDILKTMTVPTLMSH